MTFTPGMLTNEEVIQELLKLAKEIADANAEGEKMCIRDSCARLVDPGAVQHGPPRRTLSN